METSKIVRVRSADTKIQKIDVHTHIMPPTLPKWKEKFGYGGFIQLEKHGDCNARMIRDDGTFFRDVESNCWDPKVRIEECHEHSIRVQVLSTIPALFNYWAKPEHANDTARFLNDHIGEVLTGNPGRFVGMGTLPMQDTEMAVAELERCMKSLGFAGVQIGSHVGEINLDDERIFPIFQAAEKLGAAVFVHPWDMMGADRMKKYWLPWLVGMPAETSHAICSVIFGGVLEKLPKLRIGFAHGGGAFTATFGRIQHGFKSRPDLCAVDNPYPPSKYMGRIFVDSLVHDPKVLELMVGLYGENRIMLGTDYPFPLGEENPGELISSVAHFTDSMRQKFFVDNALEWLGMSRIHMGI